MVPVRENGGEKTSLDLTNEVCRYRGCGADPALILKWLNPDLPTRKPKYWPVCHEHVESLREYLSQRNVFPQVVPLEASSPSWPTNGPTQNRVISGGGN